jgi:hypothetical protein
MREKKKGNQIMKNFKTARILAMAIVLMLILPNLLVSADNFIAEDILNKPMQRPMDKFLGEPEDEGKDGDNIQISCMDLSDDSIFVYDEADLRKAVDIADTGDTIKLTNDITISAQINIANKNITITSGEGGPYKIDAQKLARIFDITNSAVTLENIILTNGYVSSVGGGIYLKSNSTLIMGEGSAITDCTANNQSGGGIHIANSELIINGGKIIGNTASNGGGVHISSVGGTITMNSGEISGNNASYGGGVQLNGANGKFTMNGGEISGNAATSIIASGGGVDIDNSGGGPTFIMSGGIISNNTGRTNNGNGVYVRRSKSEPIGTFKISDKCVIDNNIFNVNGGTIIIDADFQLNSPWVIVNNGTMTNNGVLTNYGRITNGNTLINNKKIINNGTIGGSGTFSNNGEVIPPKPIWDKVEPSDVTETSITLAWSAGESSSIAGYEIKYLENGKDNWVPATEMPIPNTESSLKLDGLTPGTEYNFKIRTISSYTDTSPDSVSEWDYIKVKTLPKTIYEITLSDIDIDGTHVFDTATVGYTDQNELTVTVDNTGNAATGDLTIKLSGTNADAFELSTELIDGIDVDGKYIFTVAPKTGLAAGEYMATVTVSNMTNGISETFDVAFTVIRYEITLSDIDGAYVFETAEEGYTDQNELTVTVKNTGTAATGDLTIELSGMNANAFELSTESIDSIDVNNEDTFTVKPRTGLAAGEYMATVGIYNIENGISETFGIKFTVDATEKIVPPPVIIPPPLEPQKPTVPEDNTKPPIETEEEDVATEEDKTAEKEDDENNKKDETEEIETAEPTEDGLSKEDDDEKDEKITVEEDDIIDGNENKTINKEEDETENESISEPTGEPSENTDTSPPPPPYIETTTNEDDKTDSSNFEAGNGTQATGDEFEEAVDPEKISVIDYDSFYESLDEVMEKAIPLANGWYALALEGDVWMIFDQSGIPLGIISLTDVDQSIENLDLDFIENNLILIEDAISANDSTVAKIAEMLGRNQQEKDNIKDNPKTGDVIYVTLAILMLAVAGVVIFKKKRSRLI